MVDAQFVDTERDLPTVVRIPVGKNTLIVECTSPYSLWSMHFERGQLPDCLTGSYTSLSEAEKAISVYKKSKGL